MDKETNMTETKRQIEVMKAYEEGKTIQSHNKKIGGDVWADVKFPWWDWGLYDYRVKPDEAEKPKKLMTYRQLSELMAKGYGEFRLRHNLLVKTHFKYDVNNENKTKDDVLIRPWGSDEWLEPTVDIYEEYISKWNKAFKEIEVKVVFPKKEGTTASEESSATVSKEETIGVHRRTPQEIADFFGCYVAMDEDGYWYLFSEEPFIRKGDFICCSMAHYWSMDNCNTGEILAISKSFLLLNAEEDHNWRTLYRPHKKPIVMEEEDD